MFGRDFHCFQNKTTLLTGDCHLCIIKIYELLFVGEHNMKIDKLKMFLLIIGSFFIESGFYWLLRVIIENFSNNSYLTTIIFLIFTFLNYTIALPRISSKLLTNPNKIITPILLFNIAVNLVAVIGSFTYLYFVLINPNYMSLCILLDNFGSTENMNVIFYVAFIVITFAKPFALKLSLNKIYK